MCKRCIALTGSPLALDIYESFSRAALPVISLAPIHHPCLVVCCQGCGAGARKPRFPLYNPVAGKLLVPTQTPTQRLQVGTAVSSRPEQGTDHSFPTWKTFKVQQQRQQLMYAERLVRVCKNIYRIFASLLRVSPEVRGFRFSV